MGVAALGGELGQLERDFHPRLVALGSAHQQRLGPVDVASVEQAARHLVVDVGRPGIQAALTETLAALVESPAQSLGLAGGRLEMLVVDHAPAQLLERTLQHLRRHGGLLLAIGAGLLHQRLSFFEQAQGQVHVPHDGRHPRQQDADLGVVGPADRGPQEQLARRHDVDPVARGSAQRFEARKEPAGQSQVVLPTGVAGGVGDQLPQLRIVSRPPGHARQGSRCALDLPGPQEEGGDAHRRGLDRLALQQHLADGAPGGDRPERPAEQGGQPLLALDVGLGQTFNHGRRGPDRPRHSPARRVTVGRFRRPPPVKAS